MISCPKIGKKVTIGNYGDTLTIVANEGKVIFDVVEQGFKPKKFIIQLEKGQKYTTECPATVERIA